MSAHFPRRDCPDCGEPLPAPYDWCVECGFMQRAEDLPPHTFRDETPDWEGTADRRAELWALFDDD